MEDRFGSADEHLDVGMAAAQRCINLLKLCYSEDQVVQQVAREIFDHVIHLTVEVVASEHEAVLLANLLDCLQSKLRARKIVGLRWVDDQISNQLWDQRRPFVLDVPFSHKANTLNELLGNLAAGTSHNQRY